MGNLTSSLGFEARFIVYPVLAVLAATIIRFILKRYLYKFGSKHCRTSNGS